MHRVAFTSLLVLLAADTSNQARAQIETLVMPGEVIEGHADFEAECANCHKAFKRAQQRDLCLDCHEDVARDIRAESGFHGLDSRARSATCASCHTDHEGRDADIAGLVEKAFDHDLTDFPLSGRHIDTDCVDCHRTSTRFRDAPADCIDCHEADNPHADTLGTACGDCHTTSDWTAAEFDHDITGYPLIGRHTEPGCLDCHEDRTFVGTPSSCHGCHAEDDVHDGQSGNECENCHSPNAWGDTRFDHDRDTGFPLTGGHSALNCGDCHSGKPFADELAVECVSCHLGDDEHEGHNGDTCESCHATADWATVHFDHDVDTRYPLEGAHHDIECNACHIEPIFDAALRQDCLACHEDDDVHEGSEGSSCRDCHNEQAWDNEVFFDHGLTAFPLLGRHRDAECAGCHDSHVFTDATTECIGCHRRDDSHDGRFDEACGLCHNPVDWRQWVFDHDRQTEFALAGAHSNVACDACHRGPLEDQVRLGSRCIDCHRNDDEHDGEFGPDCGRCHSAESFSTVRSIR